MSVYSNSEERFTDIGKSQIDRRSVESSGLDDVHILIISKGMVVQATLLEKLPKGFMSKTGVCLRLNILRYRP